MAKTKTADGETNELGTRVVEVDETSDPGKNRSVSFSIHPAVYDAVKHAAARKYGAVNLNGRSVLSDGTMSRAYREALAMFAEYQYTNDSELVIAKQRPSNKLESAKTVVRTLFTGLRSKMDYDTSVPVAKGVLAAMGVTLSEQEFADLWDAAAA